VGNVCWIVVFLILLGCFSSFLEARCGGSSLSRRGLCVKWDILGFVFVACRELCESKLKD